MTPPASVDGIVVEHLSFAYRSRTGTEVRALEDVSLTVPAASFHALLGPSGCGKSTLLYCIGGFLSVSAGSIRTARGVVTSPGPERGVVFQNFALFPWKTVRQNVLYGLSKRGVRGETARQRAQHFNHDADPAVFKRPAFIELVEELWALVRAEVDRARGTAVG